MSPAFIIFIIVCLGILTGCSTPPIPPEVMEAENQEHDLWRDEAYIYAPSEYEEYKSALGRAKDNLVKERRRFVLFRNYDPIQKEFMDIIQRGKDILKKVHEQRNIISSKVANQIVFFQNRIEILKKLTALLNSDGNFSRRQLIKAELILNEARLLNNKGRYTDAEKKLKGIRPYIGSALEEILPILSRYTDRDQIAKWQRWVTETIEESRRNSSYSIVVSKIDKRLTLYKGGKPFKLYNVELGKYGFRDKLHAGDMATPEGRYRITKKIPKSKYYKALLLNYPNEDDRMQFAMAKKKGLIPKKIAIGGLIEIHGGGRAGMTHGCIAMENDHIDELFDLVHEGTPVTIVGATEYENDISYAIKEL